MKFLHHLGKYTRLMGRVLTVPDRWSLFFKQLSREITKLGMDSIGLVFLISIFMGAVITILIKINIDSPMIPKYAVGVATRDTMLLEFSSTIMCLILAGKVGSNVASEIGTMRVTEQIDALEIMGVNSANYLILPKLVGMMFFAPVLVIVSMFFGIFGGYMIAFFTDVITVAQFEYGLLSFFKPYYVAVSFYKTWGFVFVIISVSAYWGYYSKGGALDVGKASTTAVVTTSVAILLLDVIFTQLLLQ